MSDRGFIMDRAKYIEAVNAMLAKKYKALKRKSQRLTVEWWRKFKSRHSDFVMRRTDELQDTRANGMQYNRVKKFYNTVGEIVEKYHIPANRLHNCDECGVIIDSPKRSTFAKKGVKRIHTRSTGNRTFITIMGCGSAAGNFVPPAIVFPGKKITQNIMKDTPIGSVCMCTDTGYFNSKTFIR
jgi:hypothetical protein